MFKFIFNRRIFELFLISFLILYFEVLLIRWVSCEIRIFAYFKNVILMSSFVGLGLGCALANKIKRNWTISFFLLALLTAFAGVLKLRNIVFVDPKEYYIFTNNYSVDNLAICIAFLVVILIFLINIDIFFIMGLKLGQLLNDFKPITGYSINIVGSLAGLLIFSTLSALNSPPFMWLIVGLIGLAYFYRKIAISLALVVVLMLICNTLIESKDIIWSPYYKLELVKTNPMGLLVNNSIFQNCINLSSIPKTIYKSLHFSFIYDLAKEKPENVLIVGSGMGSDASSALLNGAKKVDAVEIDPVIVKLGKQYNPSRPYSSPKLTTYVEDARRFFKSAKKDNYNFIIFGTLDSHMVLSSFSSIRIDNFVYTYESIKDAYKLLKPGGILSVTFFATNKWLCQRIYNTLKQVSGKDPVVLVSNKGYFEHYTFIVGSINNDTLNKMTKDGLISNVTSFIKGSNIRMTSDDWPFLFLKEPSIPFYYVLPLMFLILVSGILIFYSLGKNAVSFNPNMFFLGASFMLLEVKAIDKMALIFGSTWIVNVVVISVILILILFANLLIYKKPNINVKYIYLFLILSILLDYFIQPDFLMAVDFNLSVVANSLISCLPVFFAGIIFAICFSKSTSPNIALGSNMFGAMIGGSLEYLSMLSGIRFLAIIVIVLYLLSYYFLNKNFQWRLKTSEL